MNTQLLQEIKDCIQSVAGLVDIPVVWGVNPMFDQGASSLPRIGVYSYLPTERESWVDRARMAYLVKVCYYFRLDSSWPTDLDSVADMHAKALLCRTAVRNIYKRQISGASNNHLDIDGAPEQEIAVIDSICEIGTTFTVLTVESV